MKKTRIKTLFATLLVCLIILSSMGTVQGAAPSLSGAKYMKTYIFLGKGDLASPGGHNPEGSMDSITDSAGEPTTIQLGWYYERDNPTETLEIHCYAVNTNKTGIWTIDTCTIKVWEIMSRRGHTL